MDIILNVTLQGFGQIEFQSPKDVLISEIYEFLQSEFNLHDYPISQWTCFSQGLKQYLNFDDNFQENYDKDQLIIKYDKMSLKLKPKNFDFKEIQQVYSDDNTIKDIINSLYSQLQIDKNDALINIYYGQTLLNEQQIISQIIQKSNNTFEIEKILTKYSMNKNIPMCDSHLNYQISQICTCKHQCPQRKLCNICPYNNHQGINKELFIPFQIFADQLNNRFQIASELKSFKITIVRQFEKLKSDFIELLQSQQRNIMKCIEWYEKDITLFEELYKKLQIQPLFDFTNQQLEKMIEFNYEKKVEKIQEKIQNSLHIFENQINSIRCLEENLSSELLKILHPNYFMKYKQVNEQASQKQISVSVDSQVLILEVLEYSCRINIIYFQRMFEKFQKNKTQNYFKFIIYNFFYFSQYIQVFGPLNEWIGLSAKYGNISVSETLQEFQKNDRIKFGPIHFIMESNENENVQFEVKLFNLKISQSEFYVTPAAQSNNYQFENFIGQQISLK